MANTYTKLLFHIVLSTKKRAPLISDAWRDDLFAYVGGIVREIDGTLLEVNGMPDHLHLLTGLRPTAALSNVVRTVKANSSKWINETKSKRKSFSWQDGFSAFTVSHSQVPRVRRYIKRQAEHHAKFNYATELRRILKYHEVDFDPKYLLD